MQKQVLLDAVCEGIRSKTVTRTDVLDAVDRGLERKNDVGRHLKISEVLYYVGGGIVFFGIAILVGQNWSQLAGLSRVLVTLGSGVLAYFAGLAFLRDARTERVGQAFFFIAALLLPLGLFVTFDMAGHDAGQASTNVLVSGVLTAMFFASFFSLKQDVFLLFSILFATWLFYAFTSWLLGSAPVFDDRWRFYCYRTLAAGASYIALGYWFEQNGKEGFTGFLYGLGIFSVLGAALLLGGWTPEASIFWESVFPGLVFATMFLGVRLRAKSFLTFGAVFLMIYILKITAEYFERSLGWPLALVVAGFGLIAVGFAAVQVNNRYFAQR